MFAVYPSGHFGSITTAGSGSHSPVSSLAEPTRTSAWFRAFKSPVLAWLNPSSRLICIVNLFWAHAPFLHGYPRVENMSRSTGQPRPHCTPRLWVGCAHTPSLYIRSSVPCTTCALYGPPLLEPESTRYRSPIYPCLIYGLNKPHTLSSGYCNPTSYLHACPCLFHDPPPPQSSGCRIGKVNKMAITEIVPLDAPCPPCPHPGPN